MKDVFTSPQLVGYSILVGTLITVWVMHKYEQWKEKKARSKWRVFTNNKEKK